MNVQMILPKSPDAEKSLIGSVIIDPGLLDEYALDKTPAEAFYSEKNRVLWQHILRLYWDGKPIDLPSLMESLRLANDLERVGMSPYVIGIADSDGVGPYAYHYADTIMETYRRRQLIEAAKIAAQTACDDGYEQARDGIVAAVHEIDGDDQYALEEAANIALGVIDGVEQARLPTGFKGIDALVGGLPVGDLTVLAGRTSMGKSALAHNIAFRVKNTHVLSPDQPLPEIIVTETCRRSRVRLETIRKGWATEADKVKWKEVFQTVKEELSTFVTIDDGGLTFNRMISEVRRAARRGRKLVIVDHVQHVRSSNHRDKRLLMVDITGTLKAIAREENIAVLALSQLDRSIDHRPEKRPTLVDLSESKTLEEDANLVLFLYREGYYNPGDWGGDTAEVIVGKSKTSARLNMAKLLWDGEFMEFKDTTV